MIKHQSGIFQIWFLITQCIALGLEMKMKNKILVYYMGKQSTNRPKKGKLEFNY